MKLFIVIAVFLSCLGTSEASEVPTAISIEYTEPIIYPNPFSDYLQIEIATESSIVITNIIGEVVYENLSTEQLRTRIEMGHLPNGVYLVKSSIKGKVYTKRLIKE